MKQSGFRYHRIRASTIIAILILGTIAIISPRASAQTGLTLISNDAKLTDPGALATDGTNLFVGNGRA